MKMSYFELGFHKRIRKLSFLGSMKFNDYDCYGDSI